MSVAGTHAGVGGAGPDVHGAVVRSAVVMLGASIVGALANFGLAALVGRGLGSAQTGLFFAALGITTVVANGTRLGADTGLVRMVARLVAQNRRADIRPTLRVALAPVLVVSCLLAGIGVLLAAPLSSALFDASDAVDGERIIRLLALAVPLLALVTCASAAARAVGRVGSFAAVQNVLLPVGRLVGVAVAVAGGAGLVGALAGWAAVAPVALVVAIAIMLRAIAPIASRAEGGSDARGLRREFWGFALPRGAAALVETALDWIDVVLVAILAGPAEAGIYAVATRCIKLVLMLDYAARVTMSTRISAALVDGRNERVTQIYGMGTRAMVATAWPICLIFAVFGTFAMGLFGDEFRSGGAVLATLAVGMMAITAAGSVQSILLLGGHSTAQLVNKSVALAVLIIGNIVVTPSFGAVGAAVVWCIAVAVDAGRAAWQVRRRMSLTLPARDVLRTGTFALAVFLPVGLLARQVDDGFLAPAVTALAGGLIFLVILRLSGELGALKTLVRTVTQER